MKLNYSSGKIIDDVRNNLNDAIKYLQAANDDLYSQDYPPGFMLEYVNNPSSDNRDYMNKIRKTIYWLDESERRFLRSRNYIDSQLDNIKVSSIKKNTGIVK